MSHANIRTSDPRTRTGQFATDSAAFGSQIYELGSGFSDENTKVASFACPDARLAVAFAGLAKAPGFSTADWLLDALLECSKPDFLMGPTLHRFGDLAIKTFRKLRVDPRFLRTTFLFAGYHYAEVPPRAYYWHVSNYEAPDGSPRELASDSFAVTPRREIRPLAMRPTMIITAGNPLGLDHTRIAELREMLASEKPQDALLAKGVSIIRSAAANPRSAYHAPALPVELYQRSWRGDSNADLGLTRPALFPLSYTSEKLLEAAGRIALPMICSAGRCLAVLATPPQPLERSTGIAPVLPGWRSGVLLLYELRVWSE